MPNGGSDCCGTCWFNARNKGEAGYKHSDDPEPNRCIIRDLDITGDAFYTYCANHPHRNPKKDTRPIGPVYTGDSFGNRQVWIPLADTAQNREFHLQMLREIDARVTGEYPIGLPSVLVVMQQLVTWGEVRAIPDLERIAVMGVGGFSFVDLVNSDRANATAREALEKLKLTLVSAAQQKSANHPNPELLARIEQFIAAQPWRFAETFANTAPHEYIVKDKIEDKDLFLEFVKFIRGNGFEAYFWSKKRRYWTCGDHYYWTMDDPDETTTIINRAKLTDYSFTKDESGRIHIR